MAASIAKYSFITTDEAELQKIIKYLYDAGCCARCVLNLLGDKQINVYKATIEAIKRDLDCVLDSPYETRSAPEDNSSSCTACLGLLTEFSSRNFVDQIVNRVTEENFQFSSFITSLTIPVNFIIRRHSILVALRRDFPSVYQGTKNDDTFSQIKDIWKWINGPLIGDVLGVPFDQKSPFDISLTFKYDDEEKECNFLSNLSPNSFKKRKGKHNVVFNRTNVTKILECLSDDIYLRSCKCPPEEPKHICRCTEIKCGLDAVFLAGRYNKYSRVLSQTPWFIDGERKHESSVEEKICTLIKQMFRCDDYKFSSSGREDVDVQTLGRGRPFLVEMLNAHHVNITKEEISDLQSRVNKSADGDIRIRDLQLVTREDTSNLKDGEIEKTKSYSALCWCEKILLDEDLEKIKLMKEIKLMQMTPIRVLHRRPLATRERMIHSITAEPVDEHHFKLYLKTQAGTYIKEFVHGDFGRTKPNMCSILECDCDILELNVESVDVDWPPSLEET